jgi:hypothetical protein
METTHKRTAAIIENNFGRQHLSLLPVLVQLCVFCQVADGFCVFVQFSTKECTSIYVLQSSSVDIAMGYGKDGLGVRVRFPKGLRDLSPQLPDQL